MVMFVFSMRCTSHPGTVMFLYTRCFGIGWHTFWPLSTRLEHNDKTLFIIPFKPLL